MNRTDLLAAMAVHAQPDADPVLTAPELDVLADAAARADADGRAPDDAAWEETYDLIDAVASAWELKAAKATPRVNLTRNGLAVARVQVREACLAQAKLWRRRRGIASISMPGPARLPLGGAVVANGPDYLGDDDRAGTGLPGAAWR